jgi:hypothetical protein
MFPAAAPGFTHSHHTAIRPSTAMSPTVVGRA